MSEEDRIKRKNMLFSYYGQSANNSDEIVRSVGGSGDSSSVSSLAINSNNENGNSKDPNDINSSAFDSDLFLRKIIKEKTLTEIMDFENDVVKETKKLDCEMQTLVSENYNKFISATDTIRKMRSDFKKMEEEMESLVVNMGDITELNEKINSTFKEKRQDISRLNNINTLLKKLRFMFDLPSKLNDLIEVKNSYAKAVMYYCKARKTLEHYKHMPTFRNIEEDCSVIMNKLKEKLYERIDSIETSQGTLMESVNLLNQLGESMENLCQKYMMRIEKSLDKGLATLQLNIDLTLATNQQSEAAQQNAGKGSTVIVMDILEFVDYGCNNFLSSLSSTIQAFNTMFINNQDDTSKVSDYFSLKIYEFNVDIAKANLNSLVKKYWLKFCDLIRNRFEVEQNLGENTIIVRAVDRFYRRIQTINKQIPNVDLSAEASSIALYAALIRVNFYLQILKSHFEECLIDLRHNVALLGSTGNSVLHQQPNATASSAFTNEKKQLQNFHDLMFKSLIEQIKNVLTNLQAFIASDISFSAKVYFNEPFCKEYVREMLLIAYLKYIAGVTKAYADGSHDPVPYPILLILSRICLEFESVAIDYLITLADEQFFISDKSGLTNKRELSDLFRDSAKLLINHYVRVRGLNISQMIRKSVETRDWLNTIEPRNVRAVMKRIVEDLTSVDMQVGELFEAGMRKEKGSDSSRNTLLTRQTQRSTAWSLTQNNADSKLMNNIQKLFAEKIEIFCPVEFTKISVLTGIVKITLKTFLECIRLKTFSKYGLQQIQVDCHYLQLYLWRFVNDENMVYVLLEEILTSSINRCTDPHLMEPRVVELICESA